MSNTYKINNSGSTLPIDWDNTAIGTSLTYSNVSTGPGYNYITNTGGYQISPNVSITNGESATLTVNGNIVHNGKDLEERLSTIEKILNIPERDPDLEKKYPKLKKMYNEYIKELSKYRMWENIKGDVNE